MKSVRDPIHGYINFTEDFVGLIDLPEMQRLRNIKQLGFSYLVFPSATHTRFEHSLGTFYLAEKFHEKFSIADKNFMAAALLHDIGHCPFSHTVENLIKSLTKRSHEDKAIQILENKKEKIESYGFNIKNIIGYLDGKKKYSELISGDIDVDRMDYLMRDSHYTGVAYGVIDSDTVLKALMYEKSRLGVKKKYQTAIESLLIARYWMRPVVYNHETKEIARSMFRRAVQEAFKSGLSIQEFVRMDDCSAINNIKCCGGIAKELTEKLNARELYKHLISLKSDSKSSKLESPERLLEIENEICSKLNFKEGSILLSVLGGKSYKRSRIYILDESKLLEEVSPLVKAISSVKNSPEIRISCEGKLKSKINPRRIEKIISGYF